MKTALIIGGGPAGVAMAHQFALAGGWDVTLVEKGAHLGAGVRTQWMGGHPYTFGPRHFLTPHQKVWAYLSSTIPMRRLSSEFFSYVEEDAAWYNYPIHADDIARMPEHNEIWMEHEALESVARESANLKELWVGGIGPTLYRKFIDAYSRKMWMVDSNTEIDDFAWSPKGVMLKRGPRTAWDSAISGYPAVHNGYNDWFGIATEGTTVRLNESWGDRQLVWALVNYHVIVNTISPDILFGQCYGALPYIGRELQTVVLPREHVLPENVPFVYYCGDQPYTRVTEYKHMTGHVAPDTLITIETPSRTKNLHYPLPMKKWQDLAARYHAEMPENVFNIGRAGTYRYNVDIDDCILQAMDTMEKLR